jgi:hypothetical protein
MRMLSKKEIQLGVLGCLLVLVLYFQWRRGAFTDEDDEPDVLSVGKAADPAQLAPFVEVSLSSLSPNVDIREDTRNLFNYSKSPDEIAEEIRRQREAERLAREAEERRREQQGKELELQRARAEQQRINPPKPPPPPINYKFIGKMGDPKAPIAVLSEGASGEVVTAREGEVLAEKFKIRKIEYDSITIGYVNPEWTETRTIRMGN